MFLGLVVQAVFKLAPCRVIFRFQVNPKNKKTSSDIWLLENAMLEAQARGDKFNERIFKSDLDAATKSKGKLTPQASKDSAEY